MPSSGLSSLSDRIVAMFQDKGLEKVWKFTSVFKKFSFCKTLTVLRKTVESGLDPRLQGI